MDSYTIGREQFGMEKEFIIDIVQNCPNGACRYYKSQLELSHRSLAHLSGAPTYIDPQPSKKGKGNFHSIFVIIISIIRFFKKNSSFMRATSIIIFC